MNILPKKRWHVRTKDNVARVKRDEKAAAAQEKAELERKKLAEQESRTRLLRDKAADRVATLDPFARAAPSSEDAADEEAAPKDVCLDDGSGHINFFTDLERQERTFGASREAEKEAKKETEEYEKKIGLLKYLGDGSTEALGKESPWWNKPRQAPKPEPVKVKAEPAPPQPNSADLFPSDLQPGKRKKEKKSKKSKKRRRRSSSDSDSSVEEVKPSLERLRAERRQREAAEQAKTEALFRKMRGEKEPVKPEAPVRKQQYSSQFNPEFARQNRPRDD